MTLSINLKNGIANREDRQDPAPKMHVAFKDSGEKMEHFYKFCVKISAVRSRADLLSIIDNQLKSLIGFHDITIFLADESDRTYSNLFDSAEMPGNFPVSFKDDDHTGVGPFDPGIGDPVVLWEIPDLIKAKHRAGFIDHWAKEGVNWIAGFPMKHLEGRSGRLFLASKQVNRFASAEIQFMTDVVHQISNALINILINERTERNGHEREALLSLSTAIASIRDQAGFQQVINHQLKELLAFDDVVVAMVNKDKTTQHIFYNRLISESVNPDAARLVETGRCAVEDGIVDLVLNAHLPLVWNLEDIVALEKKPWYVTFWSENHMKRMVGAPVWSKGEAIGAIFYFAKNIQAFQQEDLNLISAVSYQLSIAVLNIIANEEILQRENEKTALLAFSNDIAAVRDKNGLGEVIGKVLINMFKTEEYVLSVFDHNKKSRSLYLYHLLSPLVKSEAFREFATSPLTFSDGLADRVLRSERPVAFDLEEEAREGRYEASRADFFKSLGIVKTVAMRLKAGNENIGILWIQPENLNERLMIGISAQIAIAIANIRANEKVELQVQEISSFKQQLEVENLYLQEEIETTHNYSEIIGSSRVMGNLFHMVSQVSGTSSSVLILGETGTGKELIARAIHNTSLRRDKLMVKINCATLPPNLIESELFGHERGSFTGATERRIGKFELANNSTLFLDEIGELPIELQVKLLRALQEKEIERVGGRTVIRTDVRIIAATNRDLQKEVQLGNFRGDLYFRLNVFPISIPPLRDRKEDIHLLATHFLNKHAKKGSKKVIGFSSKVIKQLNAYDWPGNVRELEHLIERSILLTTQPVINQIHLPVSERSEFDVSLPGTRIRSIDEVEREHIMYVLQRCKGKVSGVGGAAEALNIPSTTLGSKIKRLGITKEFTSE